MTNTASNQSEQQKPRLKAKERRAIDRARNDKRGRTWGPPPAHPPTMKKT
jgi:hypothetical protein